MQYYYLVIMLASLWEGVIATAMDMYNNMLDWHGSGYGFLRSKVSILE